MISMLKARFRIFAPLVVLGLALTLSAPLSAGAAGGKPLVVVELFTSQGCSSCPPADKFLGELVKRDDVIGLSLHVDYWDYIGWKDPFADPAHTRRQREYARTLGLRYVYTPQMVIDGADHATGSDRSGVLARITRAQGAERVDVGITETGGAIRVTVPAAAPGGPRGEEAAVWLAVFDREHETAIRRGENAGRKLKNHNVVRAMKRIGTWTGEALDLPAPAGAMSEAGGDGCAVIVQSLKTGRVLGAAKLALGR